MTHTERLIRLLCERGIACTFIASEDMEQVDDEININGTNFSIQSPSLYDVDEFSVNETIHADDDDMFCVRHHATMVPAHVAASVVADLLMGVGR